MGSSYLTLKNIPETVVLKKIITLLNLLMYLYLDCLRERKYNIGHTNIKKKATLYL